VPVGYSQQQTTTMLTGILVLTAYAMGVGQVLLIRHLMTRP
jgi:hypothetical protein